MPKKSPYQPALLRLLHGISAILVISAIISGFWVYNTYDRRWGSLPLPNLEDIQGIHGTISLTFLLLLPLFALYSFHLGYSRLLSDNIGQKLRQTAKPTWWVSVQRLVNTLMLLMSTIAVITGRMMKEEWLPAGEINNQWYLAHLMSWLGMGLCLLLHLLTGMKVGGFLLLKSMFQTKIRSSDLPQSWLQNPQFSANNRLLLLVEIFVILGIMTAFISPLFNS